MKGDVEISMPRMDSLLKILNDDGPDVDRLFSNAEYVQIGLLLKIYEALNHIEHQMRAEK